MNKIMFKVMIIILFVRTLLCTTVSGTELHNSDTLDFL
jgi:hypothetical protein